MTNIDLPKERLNERLDEATQEASDYINGLKNYIDDAIEASETLTVKLEALQEAYEAGDNPIDTTKDLIQRIRE